MYALALMAGHLLQCVGISDPSTVQAVGTVRDGGADLLVANLPPRPKPALRLVRSLATPRLPAFFRNRASPHVAGMVQGRAACQPGTRSGSQKNSIRVQRRSR